MSVCSYLISKVYVEYTIDKLEYTIDKFHLYWRKQTGKTSYQLTVTMLVNANIRKENVSSLVLFLSSKQLDL